MKINDPNTGYITTSECMTQNSDSPLNVPIRITEVKYDDNDKNDGALGRIEKELRADFL